MNEFIEQSPPTAARPVLRRGRWLAVLFVVAIVCLIVLFAVRLTHALGVKIGPHKDPIPAVSVTEVLISKVPTTVSIIGTIAKTSIRRRTPGPIRAGGQGRRSSTSSKNGRSPSTTLQFMNL